MLCDLTNLKVKANFMTLNSIKFKIGDVKLTFFEPKACEIMLISASF